VALDAHIVIVGGGVMGSAAAWALARRGVDVLVMEQFEPGHRHGSSHGTARIFRLAYAEPFYVGLARAALPLWRELEAETGERLLELTGGVDHGSPDQLAELHRALSAAGEPAARLQPVEAADRWPGLRIDGDALFHPNAGRLHADAAVRGLQRAARRHGADLRHDAVVEAVDPRGDAVGVRTAGGTVTARQVVVAAGAWTAGLLGPVLPLPKLRVSQEQPVHFAPRDPGMSWPSFIHHPWAGGGAPPEAAYGLAAPEGIKVGLHGAGPEIDPARRAADAPRIDERTVRRLQEYAREWLPGVDPDRVDPSTCLYTLTVDHDFVVDRVGPLTVAAGFSGHGFKFAPAIGELVADLVQGVRAGPDRFALGRSRVPVPTGSPVARVR